MASLIVQKYGGTSVGSPERILKVAARIAQAHRQGHQLVVVVSAMGHTTDELIELAHQVSKKPPHREMDMLLTTGERVSMALLSMALWDLEVPAISLTGSQTGIITNESHRRARIKRILGDRVRAALSERKVVIVAGFQGVSEAKEITTLGRGGSDTTAVALAAALKADRCEIYTDVNGVFSADPRIVPEARHYPKIRHDLMVEMATRGAGVLHPRSVELAKQFGVPLFVLNSLIEGEGTQVVSKEALGGMEDFQVTGVTADSSKFLMELELARPTTLSAVFETARSQALQILVPQIQGSQVRWFAEREAEAEWKTLAEKLVRDGFVKTYQLRLDLIPVSVVGDRFTQDGSAMAEVLGVLGKENIEVTLGGASALAMTFAIKGNQQKEAVQGLHEHFLGGK